MILVAALAAPAFASAHHALSEYDSSDGARGAFAHAAAQRTARRAHQPERQDRRAEMTAAAGPLGGLEASSLGQAMREWLWLYPAIEIVHIAGIALLFGSIAVLDLRLLGLSRGMSAKRLATHVLPWTAASFLLIVPSGLMMFAAHAGEFIASGLFAVKMGLILAAGVNAGVFHMGVFRSIDTWDIGAAPPAAARAAAALSLAMWIAVIACGRLLAYS